MLVTALALFAVPSAGQSSFDRQGALAIESRQVGSALTWEINVPANQVFLRVVGPSGEVYSEKFIAPEEPHYEFVDSKGEPLPDGEYSYEIIAPRSLSSAESVALARAAGSAKSAWENAARARRSLTRGEDGGSGVSPDEVRELERIAIEADRYLEQLRDQITKQNGPFVFKSGGTFAIENGAATISEEPERERRAGNFAANLGSGTPDVGTMDFTDSGDIKAGSGLSAGDTSAFSPNDGELLLFANTPNVFFLDTSTDANDWFLQNFEGNFTFSYGVQTSGGTIRDVLRMDDGAPADSLRIDASGNVGLGTAAPSRELHISSTNPEIRLFDDSDSTFAEITYDAGYLIFEGNSAVDVFTIDASAPSDSLFIDSGGDVGVGTSAPNGRFHVVGTDSPRVRMEDTLDNANDKPGLAMKSPASASGGEWRFETDNAGNFQIDYNLSAGPEIVLIDNPVDNSRVKINGDLVVQGTCTGCDAVFDAGYPLESIEEHASLMREKRHLPAVGPTPEGETGINVFEKTVGILQELEKAHIYIAELHEEKEGLERRQKQMKSELEELRRMVEQLEKQLN